MGGVDAGTPGGPAERWPRAAAAGRTGAVGPGRRTVVGAGLAAATAGALAVTGPARAVPAAPPGRAGAAADSGRQLVRRWRRMLVGGPVPDSHRREYAAAVAAADRVAQGHLASIDTAADRTTPWDDLPLGEAEGPSANVTTAAERLRAIAVGYATPGSALYRDETAAAASAAGMDLLARGVYRAGQPSYGNWWDWEIGTPGALTDTCALLGDRVPDGTLRRVLAAVDHFVPDPRRMLRGTLVSTGANRVDLCRVVALRGALGGAPQKLALASSSLSGVLDPVLVGDGFHADGSFLMHTCVAYPGTYGQVLLRGMTALLRLLATSPWQVAERERDATVAAVARTFLPLLHAGLMVDAVRGRAVARHRERDADDGFRLAVDVTNLAEALPPQQARTAARLRGWAKGWLTANTYRPLAEREPAEVATAARLLADDTVPAVAGPLGHFPFPDMERVVHRRDGWTYVLAMNSDRVARFEYMNGENATGWHHGDGMAQVRLDGDPYEYTDEYWPTVDPKRLPGVTVDTAPLPPGAGGDNDHEPLTGSRFSGMVALPAEPLGLAACELRGTDSPLRARRSWLFLEDAVLVAGSGVRAEGGRRVETVVAGRNLRSPDAPLPARLTVDGRPQPDALGRTVRHHRVRWAHVAGGGGVVFLATGGAGPLPPPLCTLREDRTGRWRDLNRDADDGGPDTPVTRRHLTLWYDHGTDPAGDRFAHLLLPGASLAATASRAGCPRVAVLALREEVHAFRATPHPPGARGGRLTAVVFFAAGTAAGVTADRPCLVLVREDADGDGELRVAVSDPSRDAAVVHLTLSAALVGRRRAVRDSDRRLTLVSGAEPAGGRAGAGPLHLLAETGGSHGASLAATLTTGRPARATRAFLLRPLADATVRGGAHAAQHQEVDGVLTVHHAERPDDTHRSLLRFALPPDLGQVVRAVLWLRGHVPNRPDTRADNRAQTSLTGYGPSADDWHPSRVTWDTAPQPGPPRGDGRLTVYDDWVGLEVTAAVREVRTGRLSLTLAQRRPGHRLLLRGRTAAADGPLLEVVSTP